MRLSRILPIALICACLAAVAPARAAVGDLPDEVFYHIMPIAWRDGNGDAQRFGDFGGLTASLPYLQGLGVTAIWLNPIFPSAAYHGYQHGPADQLNPWFGDEAALTGARVRWKTLKDEGAALAYWKQSPEGRWEKAA